jgi:hypothetical protein
MNLPPAAQPAWPSVAQAAKSAAAEQALAAMTAARKAKVSDGVGKALANPGFKAPDETKSRARAKIQQLSDWLKTIKALYANDPKGMAKALTQMFRELKAAVKAYRDADDQEFGLSGDVAGAAIAAPAPDDKTDTKTPEAVTDSPETAPPPAPAGASLYDAVTAGVRKAIGEDALDFIKLVRGFTNGLSDLLDTARGQAAIRRSDKKTDDAFKDADKTLKDLRADTADLERDIHQAAPEAGMRLSVAA